MLSKHPARKARSVAPEVFFRHSFEVWMAFLESSAPLNRRTGTVGTVYFLQTLSSQHSSKGWFVSVEINLTISTINY